MDYSLIVGIKRSAPEPAKLVPQPSARSMYVSAARVPAVYGIVISLLTPKCRVYRSAFTRDFGGLRSSDAADLPLQEVYFLGVIDVLQDYNMKKQLAHGWKSMSVEEERLSTVEPSLYASRFLSFVAAKITARASEGPASPKGKEKDKSAEQRVEVPAAAAAAKSEPTEVKASLGAESEDRGAGAKEKKEKKRDKKHKARAAGAAQEEKGEGK